MLLLRGARGRAPVPVRPAAGALAATGLLLPLTPPAALLGLHPLPPLYYALPAVVLAAYAAGPALTRRSAPARRQTAQ